MRPRTLQGAKSDGGGDPSYWRLAKLTVYTADRAPEVPRVRVQVEPVEHKRRAALPQHADRLLAVRRGQHERDVREWSERALDPPGQLRVGVLDMPGTEVDNAVGVLRDDPLDQPRLEGLRYSITARKSSPMVRRTYASS
jgi:hypothetical protein